MHCFIECIPPVVLQRFQLHWFLLRLTACAAGLPGVISLPPSVNLITYHYTWIVVLLSCVFLYICAANLPVVLPVWSQRRRFPVSRWSLSPSEPWESGGPQKPGTGDSRGIVYYPACSEDVQKVNLVSCDNKIMNLY